MCIRDRYNKELITLAAKKSGLTEEAIAASENQRSGSLIYSLYMICLLYTSLQVDAVAILHHDQ